MIILCLKTTFKKNSTQKVIFRDYKTFEQKFLYDLNKQINKFYEEKNVSESFTDTFKAIVNKPTPLKEKKCKRK